MTAMTEWAAVRPSSAAGRAAPDGGAAVTQQGTTGVPGPPTAPVRPSAEPPPLPLLGESLNGV